MKKFLAFALFLSVVMIIACTDGTIIGNDLLEDEVINLEFEENFDLSGQTVLGDSVATFNQSIINQTYMLGQIDDPIFGRYSSDLYTGLRFGSTLPDFEGATLDSIVLDLEYDTLGFYGESNVTFDIEVFEVTEDIVDLDTVYSNQMFATDMTPIASASIVPNLQRTTNFRIRDFDLDSTIILSPRFKIRLDDAFGNKLLEDSDAQLSEENLEESFKGLYIKATVQGSSMIGLNFNENSDFNDGIARCHVYYRAENDDGEIELRQYSYPMRGQTISTFIHDYSGSTVGAALDNPEVGDQFLYVQSMAGVNAEIEFPDINFLDNNNTDTIIINSAQLVLTINEEDSNVQSDLYPSQNRFILSKENEDGDGRILIDDLVKDGLTLSEGLELLDGSAQSVTLENGDIVRQVTFNITDYVQNLLREDVSESKVIISPLGRSESPRRTVFYGLKHPDYPAKLRIAYTKI